MNRGKKRIFNDLISKRTIKTFGVVVLFLFSILLNTRSMEFDSYTIQHRAPRLATSDVGQNLTVDGVTISLNGSYTYDTITLKNNATILVDPFDGTTGGFLNFTALMIVVEAGSAIIKSESLLLRSVVAF